MASTNPVSPKVIFGGLWSAVIPGVVALVLAVIDYFTSSGASLFPTIPPWVWPLLGTLGGLAGGYLKPDPARVTTVPQAEAKLSELVAVRDEENV